jgi:nucleoside-diphosphate-sugar epimerase
MNRQLYNFSDYQGKAVMLTGASGFSGGHLASKLLDLGAELTLLVRDLQADQVKKLEDRGARLVWGDLRDKQALKKACKGQEIVFHIAALFREAKFAEQVYFDVNLEGSRNVFEAAYEEKVRRVVHCSTNGVHGSIEHPPGNEDTPFKPGDAYQESKLQAEYLVQQRVKELDQDIVVIRPAMIWGEGDTRFLKLFKAVAKRRFPLIGGGRGLCHWLHISDLVDAFLLAGISDRAKGRVYLIAGCEILTLEETVSLIAKEAGLKPLSIKIPAWPLQIVGSLVEKICLPFGIEPPLHRRRVDFFVKNRAFDITRAKTELAYDPKIVVAEQIKRIYTWYKNKGWL